MDIELRILSGLEKVFADECGAGGYLCASALMGEVFSFQAAYRRVGGGERDYVGVTVNGDLPVRVRRVRQVPVSFTTFQDADDNYLRKEPGLFPDLLDEPGLPRAYIGRWEAVWIDVECAGAGEHAICVRVGDAEAVFSLRVIAAELPAQTLIHTKWFHCDCLCEYYGVEMWSAEFWSICEKFMRAAVKRGINMLLTPVHTPPLDTREGGERMTCQLVDVFREGGVWSFGFERLEKWVALAKDCGYLYFEIAHLFTQWGAKHAPKIMAVVNGEYRRVFGWETDAAGSEYSEFLSKYIPALRAEFTKLGILDKCYFHISDEPGSAMLEDYKRARAVAAPYLEGLPIMDALSDFDFFRSGAVAKPIPAVNHIKPFLEANVKGLWAYYCVGQYKSVTNMFVAMPSSRNRVLGYLLYKYNIEGFLQWGYNFYSAQYSDYPIDPFMTTDGDGFVPAGDAFQVYPGRGGEPLESIRMMVTGAALCDLRALRLLESLRGRDFVMAILESGIEPLEFDRFPRDDAYYLNTRERINRAIEDCL